MKKNITIAAILLVIPASTTFAADLPFKREPIQTTVVVPMWSGFYAGLNAGATWADNSYVSASTWEVYQPAFSADYVSSSFLSNSALGISNVSAGFIGGAQAGYNWQFGTNFISGAEADFQGVTGSSIQAGRLIGSGYDDDGVPGTILSNQKFSSSLNYFGTVRGRLGYLATPALMIYGTGGLAYGGMTLRGDNLQLWTFGNEYSDYKYTMGGSTGFSTTRVGWAAGGGSEWMFTSNWSAKAEYVYYDLGKISGSITNNQFGYSAAAGDNFLESITSFSRKVTGNIVRAGVNYHFNFEAAPVVAKF